MKNIINTKELIKGILIVGVYFLVPSLLYIPFYNLLNSNNNYIFQISNIIFYTIITLLFVFIYRKELKKSLKDFKDNYKKYIIISIRYWFIGLIIMIISRIIFYYIGIEESITQSIHDTNILKYPIYQIITSIIAAPIIEELAFRQSLIKAIPNKYLYIITTGLIFGILHISLSTPTDILYLIPYGSFGILFGIIIKKTNNNILSTIMIHMLHNLTTKINMIITIL